MPDAARLIALIVATKSRTEEVLVRLPYWAKAGFDEVIIVDSTNDPESRKRVEDACSELGCFYVACPSMRDVRSYQRNLGARTATSDWVVFSDDDDDAVADIDRDSFRRAAEGKDWLAGLTEEHLSIHRRSTFLAIGGYPEDMVAGEDAIMPNRVRRRGIGGPEPVWILRRQLFPPPKHDPLSRARNAWWYAFTAFLYLYRGWNRKDHILGYARRYRNWARGLVRHPYRLLLIVVSSYGFLLSPLYCLRVVFRGGVVTLRQEEYVGWGDIPRKAPREGSRRSPR